jgi:hypothetical protein
MKHQLITLRKCCSAFRFSTKVEVFLSLKYFAVSGIPFIEMDTISRRGVFFKLIE